MYLPVSVLSAIVLAAVVHAGDVNPGIGVTMLSGVRIMLKTYRQCEGQDSMMGCLKLRALRLLDRASTLENIPLADGVSLVSQPGTQRSLNDIAVDEASLPAEIDARDKRLDVLLWDRIGQFFQTHSLQLQVPKLLEESKQLLENEIEDDGQGRGKKGKKYLPLLLAGMMMKGMMVALAFKGLALLAGKALIVSKLALVLAGLIALKKLFSGGGNEKTTYEIVKQPVVSHAHQYSTSHEYGGGTHGGGGGDWGGSGSGGYGRSIEVVTPAAHGRSLEGAVPYPHLIAYRGQLPKNAPEENLPVAQS